MKNQYVLVYFIFLLFGFKSAYAQDIIVRKDGSRIYCRILKVDSASISYIKASQKNKSLISRLDVETFYTKKQKNKYSQSDTIQNRRELLVLELNGGVANPTGDFAEKDPYSEVAGLAKTGFILQGSLILKLSPYFGFCAGYGYQKHAVAKSVIQQFYASPFPPSVKVSVETTHWISQGFFGGIYLSAPIKSVKDLSLDFSVSGGLPKFRSPELSINASQQGFNVNVLQHEGETRALAFKGKMALKYRMDGVSLSLGVGYFIAKPSFTNVLITDSFGAYEYTEFKQLITTLNVEAGISILLFQ